MHRFYAPFASGLAGRISILWQFNSFKGESSRQATRPGGLVTKHRHLNEFIDLFIPTCSPFTVCFSICSQILFIAYMGMNLVTSATVFDRNKRNVFQDLFELLGCCANKLWRSSLCKKRCMKCSTKREEDRCHFPSLIDCFLQKLKGAR